MDIAFNFQRIDIVYDRYFQDSLKEQTRKMRGVGTNFEFSDDTPIPVDFRDNFLHNSQNKMNIWPEESYLCIVVVRSYELHTMTRC